MIGVVKGDTRCLDYSSHIDAFQIDSGPSCGSFSGSMFV